jgi:thymidylate kinase
VECRIEHALAKERLRERAKRASVSDGRLEIFDDFVAKWERIDEFPAQEHVVLDTSNPIETTMVALRAELQTWPDGFEQSSHA